ncbi:MAG TPA: GNAT family N-acetyltransferase, partial [Lachnoclostridium sp.]|nr:GNAT family N-acetyltransferase [Lachnoclostridium sp.]
AWKDEEGRRMGAKWALCTVSPDNPNSLNNTLRAGFEIVEEKEMYGGIRRYVLRKALV